MMMKTKIEDFKILEKALGLIHHPGGEGGFISAHYRSNTVLPDPIFPNLPTTINGRHLSGAIYYTITTNSPSSMHRTLGDMIYHFYSGDPVEMLLIYPDGHTPKCETIIFGNDILSGQRPIKTIPGGTWMGSRIVDHGNYAVMGVTMAPGYNDADYELADYKTFTEQYPEHSNFVDKLFERQSVYIFDIDENMLSLPTKVVLFSKEGSDVLHITQNEYETHKKEIGQKGKFAAYEIRIPGSFRFFNDLTKEEREAGQQEHFISDIQEAFDNNTHQGPSWGVLQHAVDNGRPVAIITARGHSKEVIKAGMRHLKKIGAISQAVNLLEVQCVNNPTMSAALIAKATDEERQKGRLNSARKKRVAAREFITKCVEIYGAFPKHKFGMSDDNADNVYSVIQAMADMKEAHPHMRFYVINTHHGDWVKMEVEKLKP